MIKKRKRGQPAHYESPIKMFKVRMPEPIKKGLLKQAQKQKRSMNQTIISALIHFLESKGIDLPKKL